jgi:uncharacterized protein (DUF1015 family)
MHPFRAHRPPATKVASISCPPYDVISTDEARAMAEGKPESFLHVIRPEIDLPPSVDVHADEVYAKGRENLEKAIRELPLAQDEKPELYVYRLTMNGRPQVGVVGCCSVDEYDQDLIRKHERTRPDKEDDRTRHVVEMSCQAEPIFLAYRDVPAIDAMVADAMKASPVYDFTTDDGVGHTLWRMPDPAAVSRAFEQVPLLYVADGHHRSASASRARAHFKSKNPGHTGDEEYNRVLSVVFPAGQLRILPYNRTVKDLKGRSVEQFLAELGKVAALTPSTDASPAKRGDFRVLVKQEGALRWYAFTLKPRAGASVIDALDVSLLQDEVLAPLLGIDDPRRSERIDFVGGIRGTGELEKLVREGRAAVAFSLYPTSLEELMAVADANEIMPPKSTWFEPKLRSGLFLHRI